MATQSEPLLRRIAQGAILCDGAMGTYLFSHLGSRSASICFDDLNRAKPDLIQKIHQEYIEAGAEIIETNTFGANAVKLAQYGLQNEVRAINLSGVRAAREAREISGKPVFIAGSVGPTGVTAADLSSADAIERLKNIFREQIEALLEGGADAIILETFARLKEILLAIETARSVCDLPIIAQMTFTEDGHTLAGEHPQDIAKALAASGADIIGANCGMGPSGAIEIAAEMCAALADTAYTGPKPFISAQPNAGMASRIGGRFVYVSTPDYFADSAQQFRDCGVRLIGGCCGSTPQHIAAMRAALQTQPSAISAALQLLLNTQPHIHEEDEQTDAQTQTRLARALHEQKFVISVELDPPKGFNPEKILAGAEILRNSGVEFVNIADSPTARVRMSSIALAALVHQRLDMEPVIHITTRDRNTMAIQSDLLGAHALGLRNILALTGDPLRIGDYPNLTGVWNTDSIGLIRILSSLNSGRDTGGSALSGAGSFYIGAALDVNAPDELIDIDIETARNKLLSDSAKTGLTTRELEFQRYHEKLAAGAHFIMTQFLYDLEPLRKFYQRFGKPQIPVLLGLSPLHSFKHAEFLHNEVRGVSIPKEIRERMRNAGEHGRETGVQIAFELLSAARRENLIQGCYLLPSYGRYDVVADLAEALSAIH